MSEDYDVEKEFELARERMLKADKNLADLRKSREASKPTATRQTLSAVVAKINQRRMTANGNRSGSAPNDGENASIEKRSALSDAVSRLKMRTGKKPQTADGSRAKLRDIIEKSQAKRA